MPSEPSPQHAAPEAEAPSPAGPSLAGLVIVATPIGNMADMSARAITELGRAAYVLCEDTRTTRKLLSRHGIAAKLVAFDDFAESSARAKHLAAMREGARLALVSDAGTPLLSDPGYRLVSEAIAAGIPVSVAPGPAASVAALVVSGLPPAPHLFLGFLPPKPGPARKILETVVAAEAAGLSATLIFYEAPHRLADTLALLASMFGDREAAVVRELTKLFEETRRGTLSDLAAHYAANAARGEIVVLVGPAPARMADAVGMAAQLAAAMQRMPMRDAVDAVAAATGMPRRAVYAAALTLRAVDRD
jgi:16S rRNA (cytidine1402-2'-O)-methyltransferase